MEAAARLGLLLAVGGLACLGPRLASAQIVPFGVAMSSAKRTRVVCRH